MKVSVRAFALALAIVGSLAMLVTGILAMLIPSWGEPLMRLLGVIAPGVTGATFGSVGLVVLYAAVDGVMFGSLLAWLYNRLLADAGPAGAI